MTRTRSGGAAIRVLIAVPVLTALALTACAGTDPETPSAAPTVTSDPPGTSAPAVEADPLDTVVAVVLRPDRLDLRDDSGATVQTLGYDLSADEMVAALTTVFDVEPEVEDVIPPCCESRAGTVYRWDGFQLSEHLPGRYADDDPTEWIPDDDPDLQDRIAGVSARGPAVGEVAITTEVGFEVGEDVASLAADLGQAYDPGAPYHWIPVESGPELGPSVEPGRLNAEAVVVLGPQPDGGFIVNAPLNLGVPST